jgi:hypothetical protein
MFGTLKFVFINIYFWYYHLLMIHVLGDGTGTLPDTLSDNLFESGLELLLRDIVLVHPHAQVLRIYLVPRRRKTCQ